MGLEIKGFLERFLQLLIGVLLKFSDWSSGLLLMKSSTIIVVGASSFSMVKHRFAFMMEIWLLLLEI
jgi:hypothetical protein